MSTPEINESENVITISKIANVSLIEYSEQFVFENTDGDEWQLICSYRGRLEVSADNMSQQIVEGHMIIIPAGCHYAIKILKGSGSAVLMISFQCTGSAARGIANRPILLSAGDIDTLNEMLFLGSSLLNPSSAAYQYYGLGSGGISSPKMQMLKNKLELFLLGFIDYSDTSDKTSDAPFRMLSKQKVISEINDYLKANLSRSITLEELSRRLNISVSYMSSIYRSHTKKSIIQCFNEMKIEQAKRYIESPEYNMSQVADLLGFSSLHYFSRIFKKTVGMSPTQYEQHLHNMR